MSSAGREGLRLFLPSSLLTSWLSHEVSSKGIPRVYVHAYLCMQSSPADAAFIARHCVHSSFQTLEGQACVLFCAMLHIIIAILTKQSRDDTHACMHQLS